MRQLQDRCDTRRLADRLDEKLARKPPLTIPLGRMRRDLRAREVARQRLHFLLLERRLEVHDLTICVA